MTKNVVFLCLFGKGNGENRVTAGKKHNTYHIRTQRKSNKTTNFVNEKCILKHFFNGR